MVFNICYKDRWSNVMFDVETYLKQSDCEPTKGLWNSEIRVHALSKGISQYVFDKIKDEEVLREFQDDCDEIEELRGWLWEQKGNSLLPQKEASDRHYSEIVAHVKTVLKEFCEKYGDLFINED